MDGAAFVNLLSLAKQYSSSAGIGPYQRRHGTGAVLSAGKN